MFENFQVPLLTDAEPFVLACRAFSVALEIQILETLHSQAKTRSESLHLHLAIRICPASVAACPAYHTLKLQIRKTRGLLLAKLFDG